MTPSRPIRVFLAVLAAGALGGTAVALAAGTSTSARPKRVTARGVDGVHVHATYRHLRRAHLIRRIRHGCELGGPNTRSARLRAPLRGHVNFTLHRPRRVTDITVTHGARTHGVGIGSTIPQIRAAFAHAHVDHGTDDVFGITLVKIPKRDGGRFQFAVSTSTHRATTIGVPRIAFCE